MDITSTTANLDGTDSSTAVQILAANKCYMPLYMKCETDPSAVTIDLKSATSADTYLQCTATYPTAIMNEFYNFTSQMAYLGFIDVSSDQNLLLYLSHDVETPATTIKNTEIIERRVGHNDICPKPVKSGGSLKITAKRGGTNDASVNAMAVLIYVADE